MIMHLNINSSLKNALNNNILYNKPKGTSGDFQVIFNSFLPRTETSGLEGACAPRVNKSANMQQIINCKSTSK